MTAATTEEIPVFDLGETPNTRHLMIALDPRDVEVANLEEELFNELALQSLKEELSYE